MPRISIARFAPQLRQVAERLSRASTVDDLRASLADNRDLWSRLSVHLDRTDGGAEQRQLRSQARFVAETGEGGGVVNDTQVERLIEVDRQAADLLSRLDADNRPQLLAS